MPQRRFQSGAHARIHKTSRRSAGFPSDPSCKCILGPQAEQQTPLFPTFKCQKLHRIRLSYPPERFAQSLPPRLGRSGPLGPRTLGPQDFDNEDRRVPQAGARYDVEDRHRGRSASRSTRRASSSSSIPTTSTPSRRRCALKEKAGAGETVVIALGGDSVRRKPCARRSRWASTAACCCKSAGVRRTALAVAQALAAELKEPAATT